MNHPETFVILTPGFPKDEADSTCLPFQQQFAKSLKETYPQLNILVLSFQYPYFKKTYKWFDVTVTSFDGRNKGGLSRLLLRKKITAELKQIHENNKIKGLISFWLGECAWMGKRFADKHGLKHYCWLMGQDAKKENKYARRVQPKAEELIALSDFLQNEFEKNHNIKPAYVIPPGIEPKLFSALVAKKDIDVLAVGSLIPLKQYDIFVEIIAELKKQLPNIKAVLVGDGPEKENLKKLIAKFGLETNVILTGELSYTEVIHTMQRAKLFLHPSAYEGFGVVCLEALAAGAPVISFIKPMNREMENWWVVKDKGEMQEKTLSLLQSLNINPSSPLPFLVIDCVEAIMKLI